MLDRQFQRFLIGAVLVGAVALGRLADPGLVAVVAAMGFLGLVAIPALGREAVQQAIGPRTDRLLLRLRRMRPQHTDGWAARPRAAAIGRELGAALAAAPNDAEAAAGLRTMLDRLVWLNLAVPSLVYRPIGQADITAVLRLAAGGDAAAGSGIAQRVGTLWPTGPVAASSGRRLRRAVARALFGRGLDSVRRMVVPVWPMRLTLAERDTRIKADPRNPAIYLAALTGALLRETGLPDSLDHLEDLPFARQRLLVAARTVLTADAAAVRRARLLNPSHYAVLTRRAEARAAHGAALRAAEERAAAEAAKRRPPTDAEIAATLARVARPAIHLARVWPPGRAGAAGRSWFGGRPCLPDGTDWPRSPATGLPLHFLAQIDCAALPGPSPLPPDGLLLFFADIDEAMLLADSRAYAVIHVPAAVVPDTPCPPPDDLPEIGHNRTGRSPGWPPFRREYPCWPVVPAPVTDFAVETDAPSSHPLVVAAAIARLHDQIAARLPPARRGRPAPLVETRTATAPDGTSRPRRLLRIDRLGQGWLRSWAIVAALVQALADQARALDAQSETDLRHAATPDRRERAQAARAHARAFAEEVAGLADLAALAAAADPVEAPPATVAAALEAWMIEAEADWPGRIEAALDAAFEAVARAAAADARLRHALTPRVWRRMLLRLRPRVEGSHHMMLGASQRVTNPTACAAVRLLCLDSDRGPGFMFCDAGVIEFSIARDDLAAGRFDRAIADSQGS